MKSAKPFPKLALTKSEAAQQLYPDIPYDCALPQDWVDTAAASGFDVRPHFVWGYPPGTILGLPLPLTQTGQTWLDNHSEELTQ